FVVNRPRSRLHGSNADPGTAVVGIREQEGRMSTSRLLRRLAIGALCVAFMAGGFDARADEGSPAQATFTLETEASPNFTFFTVRRDLRRCAAPLCGGFFAKRVNRRT